MKIKVKPENQLVAEFFSNIGVAWFTAGVIGIMIGQRNLYDIIFSLFWGLFFSTIFLLAGVKLVRK